MDPRSTNIDNLAFARDPGIRLRTSSGGRGILDAFKFATFDENGVLHGSGSVVFDGSIGFNGLLGTGRSFWLLENPFAADYTAYGVYFPAWTEPGIYYLGLTESPTGEIQGHDIEGGAPAFDSVQVGTDAADYAKIDETGQLTFAGDAQPWDDLRIEPVARTTGANAPTFEQWFDDLAGSSRGVFLYSFDDAAAGSEKEVFLTMQLPHSWNGGDIELHVHWTPAVGDTAACPRWGFEYVWKSPGEVFGDTQTVYSDGVNYPDLDVDVTAGRHYIAKFSGLAPDSTQDRLSSIVIGRLFRNSSDAGDTYNAAGAKAGLLYIDCHYRIANLGSLDEYGDSRLAYLGSLLTFEDETIRMTT